MSPKKPQEPSEPSHSSPSDPQEITLRDGESVSFAAPQDGSAHIVVNVVPPQRSTGMWSSCFQGCGCFVVVLIILGAIGSFIR